jgi:predicted KAP-like P-loop ATPase
LKTLDKKLIIIIDDLDRFTSEKLKVIFKILDLCKDFNNTSYILCYDPNNFNNIDSELKEVRTENISQI